MSTHDDRRWFSAHIELDHRPRPQDIEQLAGTMHELLQRTHAAVGVSPRGWLDAQLSLVADNLMAATREATTLVIGAAAQAGVHAEVVAVEAMREAEFDIRQAWTESEQSDPDEMLSTAETARRLGVSGARVRQLVADGALKVTSLGARARAYSARDVAALALARAQAPTKAAR